MGCKHSRPASVAPTGGRCLRGGCEYAPHSTQGHGYCCNACRLNHGHGPACEKVSCPDEAVPNPLQISGEERMKLQWQPSLLFGDKQVGLATPGLTATETMHIEVHKGELFASFGKWMSKDFVAKKPCSNFIGRLSSAGGQWEADMHCQGHSQHAARITCLKSITFTRDCHGKEIIPPVQQLTACYCLGAHGNHIMFRKDDDRGAPGSQHVWSDVCYTGTSPDHKGSDTARAVVVHRDTVTGVDRIFALQGIKGAVSGVYDPQSSQPGQVVWDQEPEKLDLTKVGNGKAKALEFRPLSLVIANGRLYMSSAAWILQRVDGPNPVWKGVIDITKIRERDGKLHEAVGGIRGMTAVTSPSGLRDSILFCWNPNSGSRSWILRCDISADGSLQQPVEETSINDLAKKYLNTDKLYYSIGAYNDMLPTKLAGQTCHLMGFQIWAHTASKAKLDPGQKKGDGGYWSGGGFAVRLANNDYWVTEVGGRGGVGQPLTAVRCYANSPFEEAIYFGGYDCNSFLSEHTGWIYKCKE